MQENETTAKLKNVPDKGVRLGVRGKLGVTGGEKVTLIVELGLKFHQ